MVCLSCGKQGHYNKLNFMCPLNNKNQANAAKYGAHQLQQKEDNEGNLPPSMAIAGMPADVHCMPAAGSGGEIMSPDPAVPVRISSTGTTSVPPVHFMSSPLLVHTASTVTGSTGSSTVCTRSAHVCDYGDALDNCMLQREATLPVAQNISGGEKTSLPVIYSAAYELLWLCNSWKVQNTV